MKKIILSTVLSSMLFYSVPGYAFFCTNCSTWWTQLTDYAVSGNQLVQQVKSYVQDAQSLAQQISSANHAMQNALKLSDLDSFRESYLEFAVLNNDLNLYMNDMDAANKVFEEHYSQDYSAMAQMSDMNARSKAFSDDKQTRQGNLSNSLQATFALSAQGLQDFNETGKLRKHLDDLLDEPDGHLKAMQASNELLAMQIEEERLMRQLMTAQTQTVMEIEANKFAEQQRSNAISTEINKNTFTFSEKENVKVWE